MLVKSILFISGAILASIVGQVRLNTLTSSHRETLSAIEISQQAEKLATSDIVREHQLEITSKYEKALNEAAKENATLRANASKSRTELNSLRAQVAEAKRRVALPDTPATSITEYGTTSSELLVECVREYQSMGEKADGHQADVRMMLEAWPKLTP